MNALQVVGFVVIVYLLTLGSTWHTIVHEPSAQFSLGCLAFLLAVWIWRRRSLPWHRTRLDSVMFLWAAALAISSAANYHAWRHITNGLWFVGLYGVAWYVLQDVLANGLVMRDGLVNLLFGVGIVVIPTALIAFSQLPTVRVGGLFENPTNLGAFLMLLIPLLIERHERAGKVQRLLLWAGFLLACVTLALTDSRGAMLGLTVAVMIVVASRFHSMRVYLLLALIFVGIGTALFLVRGDNGRFENYNNVLIDILQHPLTGSGLFTYRITPVRHLFPDGIGLYAHNLFLHTEVELGVAGPIALSASLLVLFRAMPETEDRLRLWAHAAIIGTGVHQLLDFPVMMPSNALITLIVLSLALPPYPERRRLVYARLIEFAAVVLIAVGVVFAPLRIW